MNGSARLEELTVRLAPAVLGYFARRVQPREDAADLLNETLVVAWRKIGQIPERPDEERAWLFGVAAHVLANHRRSTSRRSRLVGRIRDELADEPDPMSALDLAQDVLAAIEALDAPDPELIRLVHWEGFSASEAGRILGLPESSARARYAAAKAQLRDALSHLVDMP